MSILAENHISNSNLDAWDINLNAMHFLLHCLPQLVNIKSAKTYAPRIDYGGEDKKWQGQSGNSNKVHGPRFLFLHQKYFHQIQRFEHFGNGYFQHLLNLPSTSSDGIPIDTNNVINTWRLVILWPANLKRKQNPPQQQIHSPLEAEEQFDPPRSDGLYPKTSSQFKPVFVPSMIMLPLSNLLI